jgi:ATP-dependent helicase YprA (DUF1998 family)
MKRSSSAISGLDAIDLAQHIVTEYSADLIGSATEALTSLLPHLVLDGVSDAAGDSTLSLARMHGPYLQALPAPVWSTDTWSEFARRARGPFAPSGLRPELVEALERRGVRRLYSFQQEGMDAVLADQDVLITAATGRGKTETWLLPILQYILAVKDGEVPGEPIRGTKALLLYPTKALAQDQLRRLIHYLVPLNRCRPPAKRITVGIFDGDTPQGTEASDEGYLYQAFRLFDCPVEAGERCAMCPHTLTVSPRDPGGRLTLALPEKDCEERTPLDFVVLTRRDMVREAPDILITNPDMLHLRLLNVNDTGWRTLLVEHPRFLVIDEIHTYAETFGANVAWLIRRLRGARRETNTKRPLRVIAASATVDNGPELFTRIAGIAPESVTLVSESPTPWTPTGAPKTIPASLVQQRLDEQAPGTWLLDPASTNVIGGPLPAGSTIEAASQIFYERVWEPDAQLAPGLVLVRWLYGLLQERPHTPDELLAAIQGTYPLMNSEERQTLLANLLTLATTVGVLESRTHLFCWPVDGYYVCVSCLSVYLEPQATCRCGQSFITRLVVCTRGDELSAEGWFCPLCGSVYPLLATVDGQFTAYEPYHCAAEHRDATCLRVVWRPYGRCATCGQPGKQGEDCPSGDGKIEGPGVGLSARCTTCGALSLDIGPCSCSGMMTNVLQLPWICARCGALAFTGPSAPTACPSCAHKVLLCGGLLDVPTALHCDQCNVTLLPGHTCGQADHALVAAGEFAGQYSLADTLGRLHRPAKYREAVPCYHRYAMYETHTRYSALMRSPANVAVTASQIALRRLVSDSIDLEETRRHAKLLSFSDAQDDMEQLARDFNDPELDTFVDQAIIDALSSGPRPLADVIKHVTTLVSRDLSDMRELKGVYLDQRIVGRFIRGRYVRHMGRATLVVQGLADLCWRRIPDDPDAAAVLQELLANNGQRTRSLQQELNWLAQRLAEALDALRRGEWIGDSREFVRLQTTHLWARLVGPQAPIQRLPSGRFILTALHQLAPQKGAMPYTERAEERSTPDHPDYSRVARRVFSTKQPVLLEGRTYKGSTPKADRRRLEYDFARRTHPNFLSSGPAMEVGVDIGDLDRVLLYGTPPNINGYLQRIGRAGRRSKQALIVSVSKRNPIDLYYYRDPLRLIQSRPQPVPLQEHNERVIEVALTMAVLDYVALHFTIPWSIEGQDTERRLICAGEPKRQGTGLRVDQRIATWMEVLRLPLEQVDPAALVALEDLVRLHATDIEAYLRGLLSYRLCERCGQQVPAQAHRCVRSGCGGAAADASKRYAHLIEQAIAEFGDRLVWAPSSVVEQYRPLERPLIARKTQLQEEMEGLHPRERGTLYQQMRQLDAQLAAILEAKRQAEAASLWENQERSAYARFGYALRGGDDEVTAELIAAATTNPSAVVATRDLGPALREFAPGAVTLHDTQEYVTLSVLPNGPRTEEVGRLLRDLDLPGARACMRCATLWDADAGGLCPSCGQPSAPIERLVPGTVRAYRRDDPLGEDPRDPQRKLYPSHAFPLGDADTVLESTFVHGTTRILSFEPRRSAQLLDANGAPIGQLAMGRLEILHTADSISASYTTGQREVRPRLFEICGEPGCGGFIAPRAGTVAGFCMVDPRHDASRRRVAQLCAHLSTVGVRLIGLPDGQLHALLHGLRAGMERVAGVLVRSVGEQVMAEEGYLYDMAPGGAGICELLLDPGEGFQHFRTALDVTRVLATCGCEDGCPRCLYQYGCSTRNSPTSLSRRALARLMDDGLVLSEDEA